MRTVVRVPLNFAWSLAVLALSLPQNAQAPPSERPPEGTPGPTGEQPPPAAAPTGRKLPRAASEAEIARHFDSPKTRSHVLRVGTEAGIIEPEAPKPAKAPKPEAAAPEAVAGLRDGQAVKLGAMQGEAVQAGAPASTPLPTPEQAAAAAGGHVKPDMGALPAVSADIMGGADPAQPGNAAIPVMPQTPDPVVHTIPAGREHMADPFRLGPVQLGSPEANAGIARPNLDAVHAPIATAADMTGGERGPGMVGPPRVSVDGGSDGPKVSDLDAGTTRSVNLPSATGSESGAKGSGQGSKRGR